MGSVSIAINPISAQLRRLSPLLRLRDLLRRPRPLRGLRPAHRVPLRDTARGPRHSLRNSPRQARSQDRPVTQNSTPANLRGHPLSNRFPVGRCQTSCASSSETAAAGLPSLDHLGQGPEAALAEAEGSVPLGELEQHGGMVLDWSGDDLQQVPVLVRPSGPAVFTARPSANIAPPLARDTGTMSSRV
jgi:hypothetical protein